MCVCGLTALGPLVITEDANYEQLQGPVMCLTRAFISKGHTVKDGPLRTKHENCFSPGLGRGSL